MEMPVWSDYLIVDTQVIDGQYRAKYSWFSVEREPKTDFTTDSVPLPHLGKEVLGQNAMINFEIFSWK